jgi:hypothetical protein
VKVLRGDPAAIEVVDIATGEVVLFWDCRGRQARRMEEALRHDLLALDEAEFIDRWSRIDIGQFL